MGKIGRQTKELMTQSLATRLQASPTFLITSFAKLTVSDANELRRLLHLAASRYVVAKGTLARRTLQAIGWDGAAQVVQGSVGFVLGGSDVARTSKILLDFLKAHDGALLVRGGWMDGGVLTASQVTELAKLPSRQELLAQLVGTIEGPLSDVITTLEGVLREVTFVLDEAARGREASAPARAPATGS